MRVIVEHYQTKNEKQKQINRFEILEVEDSQLMRVKEQVKYIEMDFKMQMEKNQFPALKLLEKKSVLLVTIGAKQKSERVDAFYDLHESRLTFKNQQRNLSETCWVSCYTSDSILFASKYIRGIKQLAKWAKQYHKPLIIYSEVSAVEKFYEYRSLTHKIINRLLEEVNGVIVQYKPKMEIAAYFIPSHKAFEFYVEKGIYLDCVYEESIQRIINCLNGEERTDFRMVYRPQRKSQSLYSDIFYESIPAEQRIYVPVRVAEDGTNYFKALDLNVIKGSGAYNLIYDTKEKINAQADMIRKYVLPVFTCPILERGDIAEELVVPQQEFKILEGEIPYRGKNVYIAIITAQGVDYRENALRNEDGTTRIAGIWEQVEGEKGNFYSEQQINEALASEKPSEIVPIDEENNDNTKLLTIMGGKTKDYEGIATEAKFLVAKIKTAPEILQKIYGGMPNAKNIQMADLMIGIWRLQSIAEKQNKSVIYYVPYYTNIDSHDGLSFYNILLAVIARKNGSALIVPSGEEGDKRHHQILDVDSEKMAVTLEVEKDHQNILGLIMQHYLCVWQIRMISPSGEKVDITNAGIYELENSTIYSKGQKFNFYNGKKELLFRIENMNMGKWQLEINLSNKGSNPIHLWISGEKSNPYVTLNPHNAYVTVGSTGNSQSVTCIGGYNIDTATTFKSSSRGYTTTNEVVPLIVAEAAMKSLGVEGKQIELKGTEVSASIIAGVAATIFEKWQVEKGFPIINGLLLNSILLEYIKTYPNTSFPNPNQGYGIFTKDLFSKILLTPF